MLVYKTDRKNLALIRRIFDGYIFRAERDGVGYVKCSENQKEKIEKFNIKLELNNE